MNFDIILHYREKLGVFSSGGVYGLLSVVVVILFGVLALLYNPDYIFFEDMVSELGVGQRCLFFNSGLIFSGVMAIPFFISLGRSLNYKGINKNLRKSAILFSIISCISMSLIGCFPAMNNNNIVLLLHGVFTSVSWLSGLIFVILFSILFLKTSKFTKLHTYLGFLVAGIFVLVLCTWWPIAEYAVMIAISIWVIVTALYMLYNDNLVNRKYKNNWKKF